MSKRFDELSKLVDPNKMYSIVEAIELAKKTSTVKFDASLEVHMNLGIDPSKPDQVVRGSVVLPHGTGRTKKVAVFADGDKAKEAKEAGADVVGGLELIQEIEGSGRVSFDVAIATPDMMKDLARIAKVLGPKGLMPSPKNETITLNIKTAVEELKRGKVPFKNDETANIHQMVGKVSWDVQKLEENIRSFVEAVRKAKPSAAKGTFIKRTVLCSSMGPAINIQIV